MYGLNKNVKKVLVGGAVVAVMLSSGCNAAPTRVSSRPVEPDPAKALVLAEPGLGAADSLGHALFVEDGSRFATANTVYQMASAENPRLNLRGAIIEAPTAAYPQQVIVSAEDLHKQLLAEGKTWPGMKPTVVTSVDTETESFENK
jgi:hypothetical protein